MNAVKQIELVPILTRDVPATTDGEEPLHEPQAPHLNPVLLIDETAMTRECLTHMLRAFACDITVRSFAAPNEVPDHHAPRLVLVNLNSARIDDPKVIDRVRTIQRRFQKIPIVVLAHSDDGDLAYAAIRQEIRGYVPTTLDPDLVVAALRLVLAGGIFVPETLVTRYLQTSLIGGEPSHIGKQADLPPELTSRENDVLWQLRQGKPNKVIAFALGISESTVKVHLRNIMRKLQAKNRTQLAMRV